MSATNFQQKAEDLKESDETQAKIYSVYNMKFEQTLKDINSMGRCQYVDKPCSLPYQVDAYDGKYIIKLFESKHLDSPIKFTFRNKGEKRHYVFHVGDDGFKTMD